MNLTEWNKLLTEHRAALLEARAEIRSLRLRVGSADDMLRLRSAALDRTVEQLHEVRKLHRPRSRELPAPMQPRIRVECEHCGSIYPCPTAKAAGAAT